MSQVPEGATHWARDLRCYNTDGIQYYKLDPGEQYQYFNPAGEWVNGGQSGDAPLVTCFAVASGKALRNKACDEMFGVILNLPEDRRHNRSDIVEALYDAGYRKFEIVDGEA